MKVQSTITAVKSEAENIDLYLNDLERVKEEIDEKLLNIDSHKVNLQITIEDLRYKTTSQLGYFHAEVLPKLLFAYRETGERVNTQEAAKSLLKAHYGYYEQISVDGTVFNNLKSFADAKIKEMADIIDFAINICLDCGIEVQTPEEYLNSNKLEKFTK